MAQKTTKKIEFIGSNNFFWGFFFENSFGEKKRKEKNQKQKCHVVRSDFLFLLELKKQTTTKDFEQHIAKIHCLSLS